MSTPVLHGVDQVGLSTARPDKGHWGHLYHESNTRGARVWNNDTKKWEPVFYVPFVYDVTGGDDGSVGAHAIGGALVPAGCVVLDGLVDVITTFTSAADTATIALHVQGANDVVSAIAINDGSNPWDAGLHDVVPTGTASQIKATADRTITATVGGQALTGGKLRGFLRCVRSVTA